MLRLAIAFLIIALIAGAFNLWPVAAFSIEAARILFFVFLVLAILAFVGGAMRSPPV
jgi:uncharacterized membrane protein YtjA (UPF0391 family)